MTSATPHSDLAVTVEHKPNSQISLTIEAPASELEKAIDAALRKYSRQLRLPGFRPGKAPAVVVERHVGWEAVRQDAVETLVPALYVRAIDQEGIEPVTDPAVNLDPTTVERGQPVRFEVTVTVKPEVGLGDYRSLRVEETRDEVGDAEVDNAIAEVRKRHATATAVERGAQLGDLINCVLEMRHGEELLTAADQEREIELDTERLIPGLADAIVGMTAGQDSAFTLTLPEDYPREELRGKDVAVTCKVNSVREQILPPLDDSLALLDNRGTTLAEMREFYTTALTDDAQRRGREQFESDVLSAFRDLLAVDVPEAMIDAEVDRQMQELERRFSALGLSWSDYAGMSAEQMRGERRDGAVQRIKLELGLDELAKAEGIEVDESAVTREEARVIGTQKVNASQRRRVHQMAHVDLARRGAAERLLEIAGGAV